LEPNSPLLLELQDHVHRPRHAILASPLAGVALARPVTSSGTGASGLTEPPLEGVASPVLEPA
jgi:hypothetical protein